MQSTRMIVSLHTRRRRADVTLNGIRACRCHYILLWCQTDPTPTSLGAKTRTECTPETKVRSIDYLSWTYPKPMHWPLPVSHSPTPPFFSRRNIWCCRSGSWPAWFWQLKTVGRRERIASLQAGEPACIAVDFAATLELEMLILFLYAGNFR